MSMILMAKAMGIRVGNPLRKLVLLKLADNANDKGECWPSYQHIADHCECSKSAVREHISALIKQGFLAKENRIGTNNGKGNASNIYTLNLETPVPPKVTAPMPSESTPPVLPESIGVPPESTGMPLESIPPMPCGDTRTSHSSEPVNEPVIGETAGAVSESQAPEKINYQVILSSYHELLPEMPQVKILTDSRKKLIRTFWKKYNFNEQRWAAYLKYISGHCRWMLEDRPNGRGGFWKRKNLDYLITERCYVSVKEERANDK